MFPAKPYRYSPPDSLPGSMPTVKCYPGPLVGPSSEALPLTAALLISHLAALDQSLRDEHPSTPESERMCPGPPSASLFSSLKTLFWDSERKQLDWSLLCISVSPAQVSLASIRSDSLTAAALQGYKEPSLTSAKMGPLPFSGLPPYLPGFNGS